MILFYLTLYYKVYFLRENIFVFLMRWKSSGFNLCLQIPKYLVVHHEIPSIIVCLFYQRAWTLSAYYLSDLNFSPEHIRFLPAFSQSVFFYYPHKVLVLFLFIFFSSSYFSSYVSKPQIMLKNLCFMCVICVCLFFVDMKVWGGQ